MLGFVVGALLQTLVLFIDFLRLDPEAITEVGNARVCVGGLDGFDGFITKAEVGDAVGRRVLAGVKHFRGCFSQERARVYRPSIDAVQTQIETRPDPEKACRKVPLDARQGKSGVKRFGKGPAMRLRIVVRKGERGFECLPQLVDVVASVLTGAEEVGVSVVHSRQPREEFRNLGCKAEGPLEAGAGQCGVFS